MAGGEPEIHRIGPTLYLALGDRSYDDEAEGSGKGIAEFEGPSLEATLGLLFGLTDDTSDLAVKWDAEIEF